VNAALRIVTLPKSAGQAGVAKGIGSIAMDFPGFAVYALNNKPAVGTVLPAASSMTVSRDSYLIFRIPIWNVDPYGGRNIILYGTPDTKVWCSISQQETMKSGSFELINVDDTTKTILAFSRGTVDLPYTDDTETTPPTVLYFGINTAKTPTFLRGIDITNQFPQTVPLNILLYGSIDGGENNYGQNLPFVSIKID